MESHDERCYRHSRERDYQLNTTEELWEQRHLIKPSYTAAPPIKEKEVDFDEWLKAEIEKAVYKDRIRIAHAVKKVLPHDKRQGVLDIIFEEGK